MKVLLLQDVKGTGKRMDIKEVKDGFARNFLIPKKLAVLADRKALTEKSKWDESQKELLAKYKVLAESLAKITLEFPVKTGDEEQVFGSVTSSDIGDALTEKGFKAGKVVLEKPLKTLGEHEAEVDFSHGIKGKIRIILKAS